MDEQFAVEHVALHLVDRELSGPRFSNQEVKFGAFTEKEDREALIEFFDGHLGKVWETEEGRRTLAGIFKDESPLLDYHKEIKQDPGCFFERSRDLAARLHDVSKGVRASPGLLMVVWFVVDTGDKGREHLGLFKMDPGPSHKIALRTGRAGETLLELAVRHVEQALPDPRDQVLKWAVLPHPTRPTYHVKAKDQQGGQDPAKYFMNFLGCEVRLSESQQIDNLLKAIPQYAQAFHSEEDWQLAIGELVQELEQEPLVTTKTVVEKIEELRSFEGFNEQAFRETLAKHKAAELAITSRVLGRTKLEYRLPSGIVIRGPRIAMENLVEVYEDDGQVEFRISSPGYRKKYV